MIGAVVITVGLALTLNGATKRNGRYTYTTSPVERDTLAVKVTAVGSLEPSNLVSVSSELSGIVARVMVDENDAVTAGQLLAELDTELLAAQARQSRASVNASEATLAQALATVEGAASDWQRAKTLHASGTVSQAELERAQTAHRQAVAGYALGEAQLQQARASSQAAQTNLDKARVVSPITGVVLERDVEVGQAVVSSLQAATLFRVAEDLRKMTVDVEVDEADVGRIHAGQSADFTVAAYPDRVFEAEVVKVNLAPKGTSEVVTYIATLSLENPEMKLLSQHPPGHPKQPTLQRIRIPKSRHLPNGNLHDIGRGVLGHHMGPTQPGTPRQNDRNQIVEGGHFGTGGQRRSRGKCRHTPQVLSTPQKDPPQRKNQHINASKSYYNPGNTYVSGAGSPGVGPRS